METINEKRNIHLLQKEDYKEILTNDTLLFLEALHSKFNDERILLLEKRAIQQVLFDNGELPTFPLETKKIRETNWTCASIPEDLLDRRVEITGPVDRKMVINALNSGAKTFMADFEDSCSPTWSNLMDGQQNLIDAVNKTISLEQNGKKYNLNNNTAVLIVRPRGLHLEEKNLQINNQNISASLLDFGLYFFNNIQQLLNQNTSAYFYLPKLEHYEEARWWNSVFEFSQEYFNLPTGTIKATVLIETITASFQLDEIIFELKDHIAGLNCGRWDYIFSFIKKLKNKQNFLVPDRDQVTMTSPFMSSYSLKVIQTCHKRNILAIGGMAAQIPIKDDELANKQAFEKVKADKEREVKNGHDGTWVAHPGLIPVAMKVFNEHMMTKNQMHIKRNEITITEDQLLVLPIGNVTVAGVQKNINVAILYIESWLMGTGAAALYNLMEDAATAEISRTQLWHWLNKKVVLENGLICTKELYQEFIIQELLKIKEYVGVARFAVGKFELATSLLQEFIFNDKLDEFLTLKAYQYLN
ncbi:malate synthase A [Flavobacterium sp.]|uniref:malate synthase A n=1 Tax=Flavobacterium sp. TaxID=239 RepID=UPI00286CED60|nr:malate synthase A [Flavobacterium sp.]